MLEEPKIKPTPMQCKNSEVQGTCDASSQELLKVVVVGHVDHGKSTLLGRWLIEGEAVATDRISKVAKICEEKGVPFEPAFLLDAFEEEQSQGVSIDSARAYVDVSGRKILFIDVPGHHEFLKNMTSGASSAEIGILMLDAVEGIRQQTGEHLKVLAILGVKTVVVAINKMDRLGYSAEAFETLRTEVSQLLNSLGVASAGIIPVCALTGENVVHLSEKMFWWAGSSLLDSIINWDNTRRKPAQSDYFRMVLQDVYKFNDDRYFVGRVVSGSISPGKQVYFSPSGKCSSIQSIAKFPDMQRTSAIEGESIAIRLTDQIYVERGEIISQPDQAPDVSSNFTATIVWLSTEPLRTESSYLMKLGTAEVQCKLRLLEVEREEPVANGSIVDVGVQTSQPVAFDRGVDNCALDKFVICSAFETLAAGVISSQPFCEVEPAKVTQLVQVERGYVERGERETKQGHKGTVIWLTGLSGAGKSTLAKSLERELFSCGHNIVTLDADTVRTGLCVDLGFSPEERSENIRRLAEVAKLWLNCGAIVIVACLSPYRKDRELARKIIGAQDFLEVFVSCPVEICQSRDPKGLYRKAAQHQLKSLSGLDSPYQPPSAPQLLLDSSKLTIEEEVREIMELLSEVIITTDLK